MSNTLPVGLPAPGDLRFSSQTAGPVRMAEAAREFESLLTEAMLRSMRSSVQEEEDSDEGYGKGMYEDLMYQQLARTMAQSPGLGVAKIIGQKLAQSENLPPLETSASGLPPTLPQRVPQVSSELPARPATAPPSADGHVEIRANPEHVPIMPVSGQISSGFGWRQDPIDGHASFHCGVDFAAPAGTPITAVEEGQVVFSGKSPQYGNVIVIEHPNKMQTLYAHLAERDVEEGDQVNRKQLIGKVGSTGRSTGPHLHFEVLEQHHNVNPLNGI
jgi:murein DD-endopeptidase MepM/ murein hydrolase activator NlpD